MPTFYDHIHLEHKRRFRIENAEQDAWLDIFGLDSNNELVFYRPVSGISFDAGSFPTVSNPDETVDFLLFYQSSTSLTKKCLINAIDLTTLTGFDANKYVDHSAVTISAGTGLTGGGTIAASRSLALSHLGLESLTDPNADRILFWDDSANATKWLQLDPSSLSITDTTISATLAINSLTEETNPDEAADFVATYNVGAGANRKVKFSNIDIGGLGGTTLANAVQDNITRLGTVTTGTWSATTIAVTKGGTGLTTVASNSILYASAADTIASLASANNGALVTDGSGVPSISSTLPNAVQDNITRLGTVTVGVWSGTAIGVTKGGTGLTSTTANQLLYSSATDTIAGLATAASSVLVTDGSSVPSLSQTIPSGVQDNITRTGTITNGTWSGTAIAATKGGTGLTSLAQGDLIYGSASNTYSALTKDANSTRYLSNQGTSNNPSWNQVNLANGVTGTLPKANGGSGLTAFKAMIQEVRTSTAGASTTTTVIPWDNTIPQSGEGAQALSVAITPTNASNILKISGVVTGGTSVTNFIITLLKDAVADALATWHEYAPATTSCSVPFEYYMVAGSTSSITFKINYGPGQTGTAYLNQGSNATLGGVCFSSLIVEELEV